MNFLWVGNCGLGINLLWVGDEVLEPSVRERKYLLSVQEIVLLLADQILEKYQPLLPLQTHTPLQSTKHTESEP